MQEGAEARPQVVDLREDHKQMDTKKGDMLEALRAKKGIVSYAAQVAKVGRSTHYKWYNEDTEYKKAVDEITEEAVDFVEGKLLQSINDGSDTAIIFFLKTKGKARGYVERTEISVNEGKNLPPWITDAPK